MNSKWTFPLPLIADADRVRSICAVAQTFLLSIWLTSEPIQGGKQPIAPGGIQFDRYFTLIAIGMSPPEISMAPYRSYVAGERPLNQISALSWSTITRDHPHL